MRKTWDYSKANTNGIKRAIREFPWENVLYSVNDPNWQVAKFNCVVLNIMSKFIPNKMTKIIPKDPPWVTDDIKRMIRRQHRLYSNFKKHGYRADDKIRVDNFRECNHAILAAKE